VTGVLLLSCMPRYRNGDAQAPQHWGLAGPAPRVSLHFIPTSWSWLDLVQRWFQELTDKRIRRGSFTSVADLICAIEDCIAHHNADPKPYKWTKTAEQIVEKARRGRLALQALAV
jgi:hypothetical protein